MLIPSSCMRVCARENPFISVFNIFEYFLVCIMGRLFVIVACTLAGGVERALVPAPLNASCSSGSHWSECHVLDERVSPVHVWIPWAVALATLVVLGMPTVLLRSPNKEKGLSMFAWGLVQCLGLMLCSFFATDHLAVQFTLSLHSSVRLLEHVEVGSPMVGGWVWWELRHLVVLGLLLWEVTLGPAISIVRWPDTPEGSALQCAYLAHLVGAIVPDFIMYFLRWIQRMGRCVNLRED
jgi:hypothetical protein